jgi:hypothetical protein
MSLPAGPQAPDRSGGFAGEVTRLNSQGQFKPFVYLNIKGRPKRRPDLFQKAKPIPKGKVPPFRGTFLLSLGSIPN